MAPVWTAPKVYPRVCGGTSSRTFLWITSTGLSPRVRGNPKIAGFCLKNGRSIPACAGEPRHIAGPGLPSRVYPRVCGGTDFGGPLEAEQWGLSPRVRGNHSFGCQYYYPSRSIPACAGEPLGRLHQAIPMEVYPRVCGGTEIGVFAASRALGLSPRVRGNRLWRTLGIGAVGSIPACAGEPNRSSGLRSRKKVYPRVCGGTPLRRTTRIPRFGLSPRVRGNRW